MARRTFHTTVANHSPPSTTILLNSVVPERLEGEACNHYWCSCDGFAVGRELLRGSGIAPFLVFAHERETLYKAGCPVGQMVLVFGCSSADQGSMYMDEWARLQQHAFFRVYTAISRSGPRKRVGQHVIEEGGRAIGKMTLEGEAACYICGSINMATEVKRSTVSFLTDEGHIPGQAQAYVDRIKANKRF